MTNRIKYDTYAAHGLAMMIRTKYKAKERAEYSTFVLLIKVLKIKISTIILSKFERKNKNRGIYIKIKRRKISIIRGALVVIYGIKLFDSV